jgi:hypothetical protein
MPKRKLPAVAGQMTCEALGTTKQQKIIRRNSVLSASIGGKTLPPQFTLRAQPKSPSVAEKNF